MIAFDYPTSKDRQINTLANGVGQVGKPSKGGGISVTLELTGDPDVRFRHDDSGSAAARVTLFVQKKGDNYRTDNGRFWWDDWRSLASLLNQGPVTIEAPFSATDKWGNVQGKRSGIGNIVEDICNVGLAFGGGNAHTHGNWATGPARLEITRFEVN